MIWLIIVFVIVILVIAGLISNARQQDAVNQRSAIGQRFPMDELYVAVGDHSTVGINFADKRLVLGRGDNVKPYSFDQLSAVEVVENGATTSTTNRGSQLAGAAVGGLLFGGLGAAVGGMSGSKTTHQRVTSVALKVTVEDQYEPVHVITFLAVSGAGVEAASAEPARQAAARIHAHLINAMRQVARENAGQQAALGSADQLGKLWDMRQAGALTADEFDQQKTRLLAGGGAPVAALPPAEPVGRRYQVILVDLGPNARRIAEVLLREIPDFPTMKLLGLTKALPATLLKDVGQTRAEKVRAAFAAIGAKVDIM